MTGTSSTPRPPYVYHHNLLQEAWLNLYHHQTVTLISNVEANVSCSSIQWTESIPTISDLEGQDMYWRHSPFCEWSGGQRQGDMPHQQNGAASSLVYSLRNWIGFDVKAYAQAQLVSAWKGFTTWCTACSLAYGGTQNYFMLVLHGGQSFLREAVQEIASKEELSLHLGVVAQIYGPWMTIVWGRVCAYVRYIKCIQMLYLSK